MAAQNKAKLVITEGSRPDTQPMGTTGTRDVSWDAEDADDEGDGNFEGSLDQSQLSVLTNGNVNKADSSRSKKLKVAEDSGEEEGEEKKMKKQEKGKSNEPCAPPLPSATPGKRSSDRLAKRDAPIYWRK
jgi:hypothetical protein